MAYYTSVAASSRTESCNRGCLLSAWSAVGPEGNLHRTELAALAEFSLNGVVIMFLYTQYWLFASLKVCVFLKIVDFVSHFIPTKNCSCFPRDGGRECGVLFAVHF
jgi:hypothetical protein